MSVLRRAAGSEALLCDSTRDGRTLWWSRSKCDCRLQFLPLSTSDTFVVQCPRRRAIQSRRCCQQHRTCGSPLSEIVFVPFIFEQEVKSSSRRSLACWIPQVLVEIVQLHKTIANKCGKEFEEFMLHTFLPTLNWPSEVAHQYMIHLKNANVAELKTFLRVGTVLVPTP